MRIRISSIIFTIPITANKKNRRCGQCERCTKQTCGRLRTVSSMEDLVKRRRLAWKGPVKG